MTFGAAPPGLSDAVLVIESGIDGGAMHTVRAAQKAGIPVWVTFPHANLHGGEIHPNELPERQQGTWELLRARAAAHVSTMKTLSAMLADLPRDAAPPPSRDTELSR